MVSNTIDTLVEDIIRNELLYPNIINIDNGIIVETGTFIGGNLCRMAEYSKLLGKNIIFYGIDNFSYEYLDKINLNTCGGTSLKPLLSSYEQCYQNILKTNLHDIIRLVLGNSIILSRLFENCSIDLIFFDTIHTYEYLTCELSFWYDKIKLGGVISGHDYLMPEVKRAVDDFFIGNIIGTTSNQNGYYIIKK